MGRIVALTAGSHSLVRYSRTVALVGADVALLLDLDEQLVHRRLALLLRWRSRPWSRGGAPRSRVSSPPHLGHSFSGRRSIQKRLLHSWQRCAAARPTSTMYSQEPARSSPRWRTWPLIGRRGPCPRRRAERPPRVAGAAGCAAPEHGHRRVSSRAPLPGGTGRRPRGRAGARRGDHRTRFGRRGRARSADVVGELQAEDRIQREVPVAAEVAAVLERDLLAAR